MVKFAGTWMLLTIPDRGILDRVRWGLWNWLPDAKFKDGLDSFESHVEMIGVPHERVQVN
jgi:hypothetical protein